jgi:hypothetical protein
MRIDRDWSMALKSQAPGTDAMLPLVHVNGRVVLARKDEFFEGVTTDPAYFINVCYARATGMKTVTAR